MNKRIVLIITLTILSVSFLFGKAFGVLSGKITDSDGKPIPSANVIIEGTKFGNQANEDGSYIIRKIPKGEYTVICTAIGFRSKNVTKVKIRKNEVTILNISLSKSGVSKQSFETTEYKEKFIAKKSSGKKLKAKDIEDISVDDIEEIIAVQAGATVTDEIKSKEKSLKDAGESESIIEDDVEEIEIIESIEKTTLEPDEEIESPDISSPSIEEPKVTKPIQRKIEHPGLKAGFVDDNKQYNYFLGFLDEYRKRVGNHQIDVQERIMLKVVDHIDKPLPNAKVQIFAGNELLEEGLTYADGSYLFFPSLYQKKLTQFDAVVTYDQTEKNFAIDRTGKRHLDLKFEEIHKYNPRNIPLDILFIFDTTGSMKEEIKQLKETIELINLNLASISPKPDIRFGMVLYKDKKDTYITRKIPFSDNQEIFQTELNKVTASGGGDNPEDLQSALKVSMTEMDWREDGIKLGFIITDAPPHLDYEQTYTYEDAVNEAKQNGIKIFSIGTGGLDINGEYILRQISQYTYANYVFLTYGEKGDSEGGKPGSVSHHVGANYETDKLEAIIIQLVKKELNFYLDKPLDEDEYISAVKIENEDKSETLDKLFALAISQLVDYSSISIPNGVPAVISPILQVNSSQNEIAEYFTTNLIYAFSMNETFRAIERDDIPLILDELKLQLDNLFNLDEAARLGEFIGVKMMILGKLYTKENNFELFLKLLNVETAEVLSVTKTVIDKELGI